MRSMRLVVVELIVLTHPDCINLSIYRDGDAARSERCKKNLPSNHSTQRFPFSASTDDERLLQGVGRTTYKGNISPKVSLARSNSSGIDLTGDDKRKTSAACTSLASLPTYRSSSSFASCGFSSLRFQVSNEE